MHFDRIKGGYGRVTGVLLYNHGLIRLLAQRENQIVFKNIQEYSSVAQNHYLLSYTEADQPLSGYRLHFDQKQLVYRAQR